MTVDLDVTRPSSVAGAVEVQRNARTTEIRETPLDESQVKAVESLKSGDGLALLGLVVGQLASVETETVYKLLEVKPAHLVRLVHGRASVPKTVAAKWKPLADVLSQVRLILEDEYLETWLTTPTPDLQGNSPLKYLTGNSRDRAKVAALVERFSQTSFS